jgi:GTP:adenosylcobinamide-phosphate guanylyltransferase
VYDAVVLAGGAARRLGGAEKSGVRIGGRVLLGRVLTLAPRPARMPATPVRSL